MLQLCEPQLHCEIVTWAEMTHVRNWRHAIHDLTAGRECISALNRKQSLPTTWVRLFGQSVSSWHFVSANIAKFANIVVMEKFSNRERNRSAN